MGQAPDGEDGDVVFLAEFAGGVGDVEGGLVAEVMDAIEAEQLAGGLAGFDHAVGHEQDPVAGVQVEADFVVADVGQNAQRQAAGEATSWLFR